MRHRADEAAVLQDRAAAHPLHDPAGFLQQCGVRHTDQEIARRLTLRIDFHDLHRVLLRLIAGDIGEDRRRAGFHLVGLCHGNRLARCQRARLHRAEDAALRVGRHGSQIPAARKIAL